jgi:hypothetical protein
VRELSVTYDTWKNVADGLPLYYAQQAVGYLVFACGDEYFVSATAEGDDAVSFEEVYKSSATSAAGRDDAFLLGLLRSGVKLIAPRGPDGKPIVSSFPTEAEKRNEISPNWCDRTTWYYSSIYVEAEQATSDDAQVRTHYSVAHTNIIDSYHGKLTNEDYINDSYGRSYRVHVSVDSVGKTEQDPHYGTGGDYTVDYAAGKIIFLSPQSVGVDVRVTYHYENGSTWTIVPSAGEISKIDTVECQFSDDVIPTDSLTYTPYGIIDFVAPQYMYRRATGAATFANDSTSVTGAGTKFTEEISLGQYIRLESDGPESNMVVQSIESDTALTLAAGYAGSSSTYLMAYSDSPTGVYPSGTKIPVADPDVYKGMKDYVNDANGSYPPLPAIGGSGWRGLNKTSYTLPWKFQAMTSLDSRMGIELRVKLEHDTPFGGSFCTATFYCIRVQA